MNPMQNFEPAIGYVAPDGSLTDKGRALNKTGQEYVRAVFEEMRADLPRPAPDRSKAEARTVEAFNGKPHKPALPAGQWMGEILDAEEAELVWTVKGLLPTGGMSMLAARPKAGKSTLARCAMLAVARGMELLGRETVKGTVLALNLEDSMRKVRVHMNEIGAHRDDKILWFGPADMPHKATDRLDLLDALIAKHKPALVVIDTAIHFLGLTETNDYGPVAMALHPLKNMARAADSHIMLLHHTNKGADNTGREIMGSTAFEAAPDTVMILKDENDTRSIYTKQREGEAMPETTLRLDPTGWVEAGRTTAAVKRAALDDELLSIIGQHGAPIETGDIVGASTKSKPDVLECLRRLTADGLVERTGRGTRNSPHCYSVSVFPYRQKPKPN